MYQLFSNHESHAPLREADFRDLVGRSVVESQYVEFKRDIPDNRKLVKAIAAFANSHGGWLVIGMAEAAGGVASDCIGVDLEKSDFAGFVRNICRDLCAPFPNHFVREAKLENGRSMIAIEIPKSVDTPHICADGSVPIRLGSSTKLIDTQNHHELVKLVERAGDFRQDYLQFCKDSRSENDGFRCAPCLSIYIWPIDDCDLIFDLTELINAEGLSRAKEAINKRLPMAIWEGVQAMKSENGSSLDTPAGQTQIPFDSVYFYGDTLYFEQGRRNGLLCQISLSGKFKAHLPLPTFNESSWPEELSEEAGRLLRQALSDGYGGCFDVASVWHASAHIISLYLSVLKGELAGGFRIAMALDNVEGLVPYVDVMDWVKHAKNCGVAKFHSKRHAVPVSPKRPYLIVDSLDELRSASVWLASLVYGVPNDVIWAGWTDYLNKHSSPLNS